MMAGLKFEEWYRREHTRLVNSLYLLSGSRDAASEATDEAFTRALERWDRVAVMDSPTAWTFRVAVNALRRAMRRRAKERSLALPSAQVTSPPVLPDAGIWQAVSSLPERQRQALVLRYVADLTEADIAATLRRRRGTVASDLSRARAALVDLLGDTQSQVISD